MADPTVAIAEVRLARESRRILVAPAVLWVVAAGGAIAAAVLLTDPLRLAAYAVAALVAALGAWLLLVALSVRLRIEVGSLRVDWLGGERIYGLQRGSVTRVALRGPNAASMRLHLASWTRPVSSATLRGDERISVIRLASSATAILVPTDQGRLLIAPALEQQLLNGLAASARVQARLEQVVERTHALAARIPATDAAARAAAAERAAAEIEPRFLSGIERQILEERLAADRVAAIGVAEAERAVATAAEAERVRVEAERAAAVTHAPPEPAARARLRWPGRRSRDAVAQATAPPTAPPTALAAAAEAAAAAEPRARAAVIPTSHRRRRRTTVTAPPGTGALIVLSLAPTLAAAATWALIAIVGADHGTRARGLAAGLLTMGPMGSGAVLMARAWWPRLAPLVAITAAIALFLLAWSLLPSPN